MKIDTVYKPPIMGKTPANVPKAPETATARSSAEVSLSQTATQLSASDSAAPLNRAKIDEIKQAISEGKFKINPGVIADELIATSRQLIESQRKQQ